MTATRTGLLLVVLITGTAALWPAKSSSAAESNDPAPLKAYPFWRHSDGWWRSDNTYLGSDLAQKIPAYASLVHIEVSDSLVVETTHRFYPPGDSSAAYSGGAVNEDEGIEFIVTSTMRAAGKDGRVTTVSTLPEIAPKSGETITEPLSNTVALQQHVDSASSRPDYHTLITLPNPDRRYTAMYGTRTGREGDGVKPGDLRALALYVSQRIDRGDFEGLRAQLRRQFQVGAVVRSDASGARVIDRLD